MLQKISPRPSLPKRGNSPSPLPTGRQAIPLPCLPRSGFAQAGTWGEGNMRRIDHGFGDSFLSFLMIFGMKREKTKRPTEKRTFDERS
jgi:hypothetical protein